MLIHWNVNCKDEPVRKGIELVEQLQCFEALGGLGVQQLLCQKKDHLTNNPYSFHSPNSLFLSLQGQSDFQSRQASCFLLPPLMFISMWI